MNSSWPCFPSCEFLLCCAAVCLHRLGGLLPETLFYFPLLPDSAGFPPKDSRPTTTINNTRADSVSCPTADKRGRKKATWAGGRECLVLHRVTWQAG
jgi:hypothetical protein